MASRCAHHCCQLAAQECAVRTTARHPTVRPTRPPPYARPARQLANLGTQLLRARSRAAVGTSNRIKRTSATPTASPSQNTAHHECRSHSVVFHGKRYRTGDSQLLSYRIQEGYVRCLNRNTTPNQPQTNCNR